MARDLVTENAPNTVDAERIPLKVSDPRDFLRRLPTKSGNRGLFNDAAPVPEGVLGAMFDEDTVLDQMVLGYTQGEAPTPQYEIARTFSLERDLFVWGLDEARALQLGMGHMEAADGSVTGESPRASGAQLDRIAEQYGLGRPRGFTDACYWRLLLLVLFQPGPTLWRMREIAALYTGIWPTAEEIPCKITLSWPASVWATYFDHNKFLDRNWWWNGDAAMPGQPTAHHGYYVSGDSNNHQRFWGTGDSGGPPGFALIDALDVVKPAGVAVELVNAPSGISGCYGACARGTARKTWEFYWA